MACVTDAHVALFGWLSISYSVARDVVSINVTYRISYFTYHISHTPSCLPLSHMADK